MGCAFSFFKSESASLQILFNRFTGNPPTLESVCDRTCRIGTRKRINYHIALSREHLNEKFRQLCWKPSRVNLDTLFLTATCIRVVCSIVAHLEHTLWKVSKPRLGNVGRDCPTCCDLVERLSNNMAGRSHRSTNTIPIQPDHILTVFFEHVQIRGLGPRCLGQPPYILDRIPNTDSPYSNPLRWHRHLRGVVPETFLSQMEPDFFNQSNQ